MMVKKPALNGMWALWKPALVGKLLLFLRVHTSFTSMMQDLHTKENIYAPCGSVIGRFYCTSHKNHPLPPVLVYRLCTAVKPLLNGACE
jgi:hypothetical protein